MEQRQLYVADRLIDFFSNNLRIPKTEIDYDTPLFGDGIGLDSVDSLEVLMGIDSLFGIPVFNINQQHLSNIRTLSDYISGHPEYKEQ